MKYIILILLTTVIFSSCNDELFQTIHPENDEAALAAMGEAFEMAFISEDSLEYYTDIIPDVAKAGFFDNEFHTYSLMYDTNHQIYSHLNAGDDHHHVANPPDHKHFDEMVENPFGEHHHEGEEHGEEGHEEEFHHTMENHLEMLELQQHHLEYHPN